MKPETANNTSPFSTVPFGHPLPIAIGMADYREQDLQGADLFNHLIQNKSQLITHKKTQYKKTDATITNPPSPTTQKTHKHPDSYRDKNKHTIQKNIIANTYYWMDNHDDVHIKQCFQQSIDQPNHKIYHLHDHEFKLTSQVGDIQHLQEKNIPWKQLGINKQGNTTCLVATTNIHKHYNKKIYKKYANDTINQHSVGMYYTTIDLALNHPDHPEEYKNWNQVYPKLGNPEKALENNFFWIIKQAQLIEISCVLQASNPLTPTLQNTQTQTTPQNTDQDTQEQQNQQLQQFYNQINL